jgi:prolipoprotein diacylglyceryltransferase
LIHVATHPAAHLPFDLLSWAAGLGLGGILYRWRLKDATDGFQLGSRPGYFAALAAGAIPGAWLAGSLNTLNGGAPALSHSVVGALIGAIIGVEIYKAAFGIRRSTGAVFVGSFAMGVVIGRWGCLFTGLPDRTYGVPTSLPWGVDLGDGVARHPVQVYESASMALFLGVYLAGLFAKKPWVLRRAFYALCIWYGVQRFVWEFLKPYPPIAGPFNLFHLLCAGLVAYGLLCWRSDLARERFAQERALSVPRPDHQPV